MPDSAPIRYRITPIDPYAHLFEVRCSVDAPAPVGQRFRLPSWIPGSYLIREFARNFVAVRAENDAGPVSIVKEAKDLWRAAPCAGPLTVVARVHAYDLSVRAAYLDATRGFFNGSSVFLAPEGCERAPCTVDIVLPRDPPFERWRIATTLAEIESDDAGVCRYRAANYDEVIDHPVEMADCAACSFTAGGARHDIAITGRHDADLERLARDLQRICQWQIDLFGNAEGSAAPFARYLFLVNAVGDGYGGLEHRTSTALICRRDALPAKGATEPAGDYVSFLGLASHEYFHAWNVKRIGPAAYMPYDLSRESYTRLLWAFEGITSYYDDLALLRSGVIGVDMYLELVGRTITAVLRTPGRAMQSVAESSFDAWIKFYRPDGNSPNAGVSYYAKGALVALALDLTLRRSGRGSLDDVMRMLWRRHGITGIGVPEEGVRAMVSEIAGDDLAEFFARYVDGTDDPPLAELLAEVGVVLKLRAATGPKDRGGRPATADDGPRCWLGAKLAPDFRLQHVFSSGPAERAGLAPGDVLIAIDGLRATDETLASMLRRRAPGERVAVHAFRRDELATFDVTLAAAPFDTCYLTPAGAPSDDAARRRAAWLGTEPKA